MDNTQRRLIMRPARLSDFDALMYMAEESGPGFTSLPVNDELITSKLKKSEIAFARQTDLPQTGKFLMMAECADTGEIGGCSAVKAGTGIDQPFFNYRIITLAQASLAAKQRFDMDALVLTNEFVGYTEVGTLFLRKSFRGGGAGRLLAQSRYLLMASAPDEFGEMVLAELRGVVSEDGNTPFWDCLGQNFFRMSFQEADYLSAVTDNQFILDLMPKYPIYIDLLPPEAREVIGRCHADGVGAQKLLEWEGMRFARTIDIFDGGPLMSAPAKMIRTIRESRIYSMVAGLINEEEGHQALLASPDLENFRACHALVLPGTAENTLRVSPEVFDQMQIKPGDQLRVWVRN